MKTKKGWQTFNLEVKVYSFILDNREKCTFCVLEKHFQLSTLKQLLITFGDGETGGSWGGVGKKPKKDDG